MVVLKAVQSDNVNTGTEGVIESVRKCKGFLSLGTKKSVRFKRMSVKRGMTVPVFPHQFARKRSLIPIGGKKFCSFEPKWPE